MCTSQSIIIAKFCYKNILNLTLNFSPFRYISTSEDYLRLFNILSHYLETLEMFQT